MSPSITKHVPSWTDSPNFARERRRSRLFFNLVAPAFALIDRNLQPAYRESLEKLALPNEWSVLDLATGTGSLAMILADRGHRITGIDFAPKLLRKARKRLPNSQLREMDLVNLPDISDESFDLVTMAYLLHGVPEDFRRFLLDEARRIARHRVLVFDYPGPGPWHVRLIEKIEGPHYREFVSRDFRNWARGVGFHLLRRGVAGKHGAWWLIEAGAGCSLGHL